MRPHVCTVCVANGCVTYAEIYSRVLANTYYTAYSTFYPYTPTPTNPQLTCNGQYMTTACESTQLDVEACSVLLEGWLSLSWGGSGEVAQGEVRWRKVRYSHVLY